MAPKITYFGYRISSEGVHPTEENMRAIKDAPISQDVSKLKSYLGLLSYCGKFLPNLSQVLAPLYELLKHLTPWKWGKRKLPVSRSLR